MEDIYALAKQKVERLRQEDFIGWIKQPVLLVDIVDAEQTVVTGPAMSIESTVLFQDGGTIGADGDDEQSTKLRSIHRLRDAQREPISIGRAEGCDIVIDHHSISKLHAFIDQNSDGSYVIRDAGSRNGVTINGRRVTADHAMRMRPDDVVRIGAVLARIVYPRALFGLLKEHHGPPTPTGSMWRPLRDRTFRRFWFGLGLNFLADSIYRFALTSWVMSTLGSGAAMSTLAIFMIIPMLVMLLGGGIFVDRLPRSRVMLMSIALRGIVIAMVALAQLHGHLAMVHLCGAAAALGVAEAFFLPSYSALVPELVPREDLPTANAINVLAVHGASIIGPAIGAGIIAAGTGLLGGHALAFSIVGILFMTSATFIARLPATKPSTNARRAASGGLREPLRIMVSEPWLWMTSLTFGLAASFGFACSVVVLPLLVKNSLHLNIAYFGALQALFSAGALVGSLWTAKRRPTHRRGRIAYAFVICIGLSMFICALPITIYGVAALWLLRGISVTSLGLIWVGTLQQMLPREMLGRVASIDAFGSVVLLILSFIASGALTQHVQPEVVMLIAGTIVMATAVLALLRLRIRNFD